MGQERPAAPEEEKKYTKQQRATRALWDAMQYSRYFKGGYKEYLPDVSHFTQLEQMYLCMVTGVPEEKVQAILKDTGAGLEAKAEALEKLWKKPPPPDREGKIEDNSEKRLRDYLQQVELQVTKLQKDVTGCKADLQRVLAADTKKNTGAKSPSGELPGRARASDRKMEKLENEVAALKKILEEQQGKLQRILEEGSQVRGIILKGEPGNIFSRLRRRKKVENEAERMKRLLEEGYQAEQIDFILQCREEGVDWDVIRSFAGKEIPVAMMKKLKAYYTKEAVPDSGTREGGEDGE